ncbi:MAG: ABC transporter substrate-binding protein [Desulfobacteraceae bacterium]|nr:ABC transporter substrate-binding protein [Desulfobacteraceae bacterium]
MKKIRFILTLLFACLCFLPGSSNAAKSGGQFNFIAPYGGDLSSLDPHKTNRTQDYIVIMNIHRSLYKWSAEEGKPVLALADSVKVSPDRLTYTYELKKNVKFHNGRTMTADDIIWSYERILTPETMSSGVRNVRIIKGAEDFESGKAATVQGLKKLDDHILQITLKNPVNPGFSFYPPEIAVLPKEEVETRGDGFGVNPVGCGPFEFVKWVKGSEVVLEKFDGYYEAGKPYLDKVVYKIMPEAASRDIAFKVKELDATTVGSVNYPEYKGTPAIAKNMMEVAELWTRVVCFNLDYGPFKNKKVRQAINHAINTKLINKKLLKGKAVDPVGYLPPSSPAFGADSKGYDYNPEKAKQLLKEAGYSDGFTFECLGTDNGTWGVKAVEALIPMLKKVGIKIVPVRMEGAAMSARAKSGDFQALIWSLDSGPDPLTALSRWESVSERTGGNYMGYKSDVFDNYLDLARAEIDESKKMDYLKKADQTFIEDAPVWFYNYNKAVMAYQPWVHGLQPVAVELMYQDLTSVWVDEKSPRK